MMKHLKTLFFSILAGAMLAACGDDKLVTEPDGGQLGSDDGEGFYMGIDIRMPDGTSVGSRSVTIEDGNSSGGIEIGADIENSVGSALIVLASSSNISTTMPKYGFIAASEVQNNRVASLPDIQNNKLYRATARIQKTNLNEFYNQLPKDVIPQVYVFVFCNPTKELVNMFTDGTVGTGSTAWLDKTCKVVQGSQTENDFNLGIWGSNSFLMNNDRLAIRALPANLLDWEGYNSAEKAFHLSDKNDLNGVKDGGVDNSSDSSNGNGGSVKVERSVARFDFRDGSGDDNTYTVLYAGKTDGTPNEKAPLVSVKLQKMCLVNMSNKFYYIPRVSDDGQLDGKNYEICGIEKPWTREGGIYKSGNYVVGPYADVFGGEGFLKTGFSTYFNFPFFEDDGSFNNKAITSATRWDVVSIDDVLKGRDDNYEGVNNPRPGQIATNPSYKPGDYKVWRYVTENVIPAGIENQVNGISTGIIFRGRILGAKNVTIDKENYPEEYWAEGNYANLLKCLNGEEFTYNGKTTSIKGTSADPILYYYSGNLYMGWRVLRQAAIQAAITVNVSGGLEINRSANLYKIVFGDGPIPPGNKYVPVGGSAETSIAIDDPRWGNDGEQALYDASADAIWNKWNGEDRPFEEGGDVHPDLKIFRERVTDAGVTIYQSALEDSTPGYYCYYYYWNRHNDNGIAGAMGPMEFDVVRNNVYKLSVEKISRLGHPRFPGNDPDDPKPDTPDESDILYLDVRVSIVPWAVRLNSIQF